MAEKTKKIGIDTAAQWYVRDESSSIFGPVEFKTLQEWVADGRVSPLSYVSSDEKNSWSLAVGIDELQMNCIAEIDPGSFYGPIHAKAMQGLIKTGSIPKGAVLYRRGGAEEKATAPVKGISPEELRVALDKAAALEFEKKNLEAEFSTLSGDLDTLRGQIAKLCSERDEMRATNSKLKDSNKELSSGIDDLRNELNLSAADRDAQIELVDSLESEVKSFKKEIAGLKISAEKVKSGFQSEIESLNELNSDLKSNETKLQSEIEGLGSKIEELRKNGREHQRVMDERERLHAAELKEKESSCSLRIDNMILEHETAVNTIRHEAIEETRTLQDEVRTLQGEVKALQKLNRDLENEKDQITKKASEIDKKSGSVINVTGIQLEKKELLIKELTADLDELKKTNELLKKEFIKFEELKNESVMDLTAQRKLVVLRQLFVEAASLLDDVEELEDAPVGDQSDGSEAETLELLEFEEVPPHESHAKRASSAKGIKQAVVSPPDTVKDSRTSGAAPKPKKRRSKGGKKWPFGGGKKDLDSRSLAELEAQARIELQRLSSKGGNISALFDKNK